ncbi:MAG: WbqC family protein [Pseudomonadota bacterium]|nr:WbqC family protein [Pseudomonadota bacterium]
MKHQSGKRVAIVQSCYIPWKGYFDLIAAADAFIFYDDVQYTRQDWRNRNRIKTQQGLLWLTVPVKFGHTQLIRDTEIAGSAWAEKHWRSLCQYYKSAPWFGPVAERLEPIYRQSHTHLSALNRRLIATLCDMLRIDTPLSCSWEYERMEGKSERLVHLCQQVGAAEYISGPAAKDYLDVGLFEAAGIKVSWFDYDGYPEYRQLWGGFEHNVSILDLLFNCGPEARRYMKCGAMA